MQDSLLFDALTFSSTDYIMEKIRFADRYFTINRNDKFPKKISISKNLN